MEEIDDIEKTKFRELIFLHNTKVSSTWELKNCIRGEFWRVFEDLHEFFEFNWFCYNIIKIKNILIININLSFFLKITLSKNVKDFTTLPYISIPPKFSLSLPSKLPNKILIYLLSYQYLQVGVFAMRFGSFLRIKVTNHNVTQVLPLVPHVYFITPFMLSISSRQL